MTADREPRVTARDDAEMVEAVAAFHRCSDVHPERHDMGGSGTCHACRSWAAHLAAALLPLIREREAAALREGREEYIAAEPLGQLGYERGRAEGAAEVRARVERLCDEWERKARALHATAHDHGDVGAEWEADAVEQHLRALRAALTDGGGDE